MRRYETDEKCPPPAPHEAWEASASRFALWVVLVSIGLSLLLSGIADAAYSTATHTSYAFRPCSTCREVAYPTEAACRAAALAEPATKTRVSGSAVYTCITRHNVIATFTPDAITGTAVMSWTAPTQNTDGSTLTNLAGYRIVYGQSPDALTRVVEIANPGITRHTLTGLSPGTYYFAVQAYTASRDSAISNIASKVIP